MALTKHIMVRVNEQDYNMLSKQAEDARLSISAFARQKLLRRGNTYLDTIKR